MDISGQLRATAEAAEAYIQSHLFDPEGLMYSGIDSHTGRPFEREFITPRKVPRRAEFDPWSYWSYEDSVMTMGLYLDGLVLQYELTGDADLLERALRLWQAIEKTFYASQVHGHGCFLRPYGGFLTMEKFMEPLGTDQATNLFSGLYRYLPHAKDEGHAENIRRVMLETLRWYERKGFKYFYYKMILHGNVRSGCHSNSYFLPAIAWAATVEPENPRWGEYLDIRLELYRSGVAKLQPTFHWGSDLGVLRDVLGERFGEVFTPELLEEARQEQEAALAEFETPGLFKRACPESADPDFQPYVAELDPEKDSSFRLLIGFPFLQTRHHGRSRPRHESHVMLGLASVGCRPAETLARAGELLAARSQVPGDFMHFMSEDYDRIPETAHLYARSVGVILVGWWRDYWLWRTLQERS